MARATTPAAELEVVDYFVAVGDGILGALRDRPTTLERWPKGYFEGAKLATRMDSTGDAFYQKRVPQGAPDYVQTARIAFPSGRGLHVFVPIQPRWTFTQARRATAPSRRRTPCGPAAGDPAPPAYSLEPLLELAAKDERDHGHGDLPYPPEYPKMPGEPTRVQPSRDRDRPPSGE